MPSIPLYPPPTAGRGSNLLGLSNPLPTLLQTPSGLAILELQGTINMPTIERPEPLPGAVPGTSHTESHETHIGRLIFPDYNATSPSEGASWMKRVYLYVGRNQRLTGEVKKLPKPIAVIRRRTNDTVDKVQVEENQSWGVDDEQLEIVEIVRWKILFSQRPEPVGGMD
ncbi:MAG: hypothetical protein M1835_004295 [Candelina submexicana]|nr:MAG: hypothetical protein M1835_004295 [Candelina submexicana]